MKKELTITNLGLCFVDGDKTKYVSIDGGYVDRENKRFSISCGLVLSKDKKGKEVAFVCPKGDEKATVKEVFLNFKFTKDGKCYQIYAKDRAGKFYNSVILQGCHRIEGAEKIEITNGDKTFTYSPLALSREIKGQPYTKKDGTETTIYNCALIDATEKKVATKTKDAKPSKPVAKKEKEVEENDLPF